MIRYLNILDFSKKQVKIVRLTPEESEKSTLYGTTYDFLQFEKLDEKYDFDLGNSEVMITDEIRLQFT